jgi:hypothetical protein
MKTELKALTVPASVAAGAPKEVAGYVEKTIQIMGTFVATLDVEISLDGARYQAVHSGITAPGFYTVPHACKKLRIRTTAFTSGVPEAWFGGFDSRSF